MDSFSKLPAPMYPHFYVNKKTFNSLLLTDKQQTFPLDLTLGLIIE